MSLYRLKEAEKIKLFSKHLCYW